LSWPFVEKPGRESGVGDKEKKLNQRYQAWSTRHLPETFLFFGLSRSWPCAVSVMGTDPCTSARCDEAVFGKGHHPNG
jgi:hypothetical protein